MAEEVLTLKVQMESARTQRELEQLRAKATAFRKDQVIGSEEFAKAAKLEADIKNKLHTLNVQAYSDNARMKESYFRLGTELRAHKTAALNLAGALGADRTALGGVLMALSGPGGWLALTTAGLAAMILHLKDVRDWAQKAATEGFDRLAKSQLGAMDRSAGDLKGRAAAGRAQISKMMRGYRGELTYESAMLLPSGVPGAVPKEDQIRYDFLKKIVGEAEAELAIREAILVAKQNEIVLNEVLITGQRPGKAGAFNPNDVQMGFVGPQTYGDYVSGQIGQHGGASTGGISAYKGSIPGIDQTYGSGQNKFDIIGAAESLKNDLEPVWENIGASIITHIGGAFAAAFAGAEFNAWSFFGGILSIIGVATGNPFLIGGGAFIGQLGTAAGNNLTAGGGGSSTSHTGIKRGGGGNNRGVIELVSVVRGSDLLLTTQRAGTNRRRGMV